MQCVAFNTVGRDGKKGTLLATGSCESEVRIFDVLSGEMLRVIHAGNWVSQVCFSPGSRLLAIGGRDNQVSLRDVFTGEEVFNIQLESWVQVHAPSCRNSNL